MDANLKKIQITPVKFDKEGDIKASEFATVTLEIPMDSTAQRAAIIELCELLDQEWVVVNIDGKSVVGVSTT